MKRPTFPEELFSDVKNFQNGFFMPGQIVPFDMALLYPSGVLP